MLTHFKIDYNGWSEEASPVNKDIKVKHKHSKLVANGKIGIALKGKPKSEEHKEKIKKTGNLFGDKPAWNKNKSGYKAQPHSEETKLKMSEKAKGRVITKEQRVKTSNTLSIPIIATNIKTKKKIEFKSTKEAKEKLGLTGILHVLKGRYKQCGGYFFEYKK